LFLVLVGETSVARKGMSWAEVVSVFEEASPGWRDSYVYSGFGSGEGLIARVAERMASDDTDAGTVHDPRLVVHEAEFASVLRVASREGSILSSVIRDAWDGAVMQNNVKQRRLVAPSGHLVSLVAHVTAEELRRELTRTDIANGLGNRFVFAKVRRTRRIAHPVTLDPSELAAKLRAAMTRAAGLERVGFTESGADAWTIVYEALEDAAEGAGGLVGPLIARGSAQTLRTALVYALLDGAERVGAAHVEAATAFWLYCSRTVQDVFGTATGNPIADRIAEAVSTAPDGLTRTDVYALLGRNYPKEVVDVAIGDLTRTGRYRTEERATAGRPVSVLLRNETNEVDEERSG
jgi:hypothetical protein